MSWEKRNKQTYFYRRRRVNGRIVSDYLGRGPLAQAAQVLADQEARQKTDERAVLQELDRLAQMVDEYGEQVKMLVAAHLYVNGYHYHRGEWRKRRKPKIPTAPPSANPPES